MGNSRYCLTKADLADAIYAMLPLDKQKAAQIVEDYIEIIKAALEADGKVMLSGFGAYEVKHKPREGVVTRKRARPSRCVSEMW